jgi:hypothetical protein
MNLKLLISTSILIVYPAIAGAHDAKTDYFKGNDKNSIIVVKNGSNSIYYIQVQFADASNASLQYVNTKLNLLTRYVLLKHLQGEHKNITGMQISGLTAVDSFKIGSNYFKISKVDKDSVKLINGKFQANAPSSYVASNSESEVVNSADVHNHIQKEIHETNSALIANPNSLTLWTNLFNLYFVTGNLEEANRSMDKVIELTFKND